MPNRLYEFCQRDDHTFLDGPLVGAELDDFKLARAHEGFEDGDHLG